MLEGLFSCVYFNYHPSGTITLQDVSFISGKNARSASLEHYKLAGYGYDLEVG